MKSLSTIVTLILLSSLFLLTACGGSAEPAAEDGKAEKGSRDVADVEAPAPTLAPTAVVTPTLEATPEIEPSPTPASSLIEVESAVVRIEAEGSFIDPAQGYQFNVSGSGSGFIISPEGLAVTNNHVVTGAAILRVYVAGEDEPRNARVLGVSECSDLALIDIEGNDFPFLDWYDGDINVGLEVYAAGYPLGENEFTLTRGIISKARTSGETEWASVDSVMEHDATLNPGNSGGPLITESGEVVGINFAGNFNASQYFAIGQAEVERVLNVLEEGDNLHALGINGMALSDEQGGLGIWVSSVESGSPADKTGIQGGDLIVTLEGLSMAMDGTMSDYCDVLRTHNMEDTLSVTILRLTDDGTQYLEGRINGPELELVSTFGAQVAGNAGGENTSENAPVNDDFVTYFDDTGTLEMSIPAGWEVVTTPPDSDLYSAAITAAPELAGIVDSWEGPGISVAYTDVPGIGAEDLFAYYYDLYTVPCQYESRESYDDGYFVGEYDFFYDCDGTTSIAVMVLSQPGVDYQLLIQVQYLTDAQLDELINVLVSIFVLE